jgi:hypothetical protein
VQVVLAQQHQQEQHQHQHHQHQHHQQVKTEEENDMGIVKSEEEVTRRVVKCEEKGDGKEERIGRVKCEEE